MVFLFIETNCPPGYLGRNCAERCRYPSYGIDCQGLCGCEEKLCDVATGCISPADGTLELIICFTCKPVSRSTSTNRKFFFLIGVKHLANGLAYEFLDKC